MSDADKSNLQPWRLRFGRDKFLHPRLLFIIGLVYAAIFLMVTALMYILNWIVPHLPWISKPYVSPDPPPLVTAFYCANLMGGSALIIALVVYLGGPRRQILPLRPRKKTKT